MNKDTIIEALERPELLDQEVTRREALRRGGVSSVAMAFAAAPLLLAGLASRAFGQSALPQKVINVLNFALLLEYLESEFYNKGLATSGLIPAADRAIFEQVAKHENAHVAFLAGALGARAVKKPAFDFTAGGMFPTFTDYETFKLIAQAFEDTGVRAYKGRAPDLMGSPDILTAALRIHSVEARHAAEIRRLRGQKGWVPFDDPAAPAPIKAVYAGEQITMQLGVDVSRFEGAEAGSEAFDEPLVREEDVLMIAAPFFARA